MFASAQVLTQEIFSIAPEEYLVPGLAVLLPLTSSLKSVARSLLPRPLWLRLSAFRGAVASLPHAPRRGLTGPIARAIRLLPLPWAVQVKQMLGLTGRLDYDQAVVWMTLECGAQLKRLRACSKEPETLAWIERHIRAGDVFYDIGANVGAYSFVAFHAARGHCTVYAFEPSYSTFAALSQNVALNGCQGKIIPLNLALADQTALLHMSHSTTDPGAASHQITPPVDVPGGHIGTERVLGYRLDDLIHQFDLPLPHLIKLDVDGPEFAVLKGAEHALSSDRLRSVLVEVDESLYPEREIPNLMAEHGFALSSRHLRSGAQFNYIFERLDAGSSS